MFMSKNMWYVYTSDCCFYPLHCGENRLRNFQEVEFVPSTFQVVYMHMYIYVYFYTYNISIYLLFMYTNIYIYIASSFQPPCCQLSEPKLWRFSAILVSPCIPMTISDYIHIILWLWMSMALNYQPPHDGWFGTSGYLVPIDFPNNT